MERLRYVHSITDWILPLQFKLLYTTGDARSGRKLCFGPFQITNQDVMPSAYLEGYGSNSASNIQSRNLDAVPKYEQHDYDSNATASESEDDRIGAKKFDGQFECDYDGEGDSLFS